MLRIGLIADYGYDTCVGPQVAQLLRSMGVEVVEIPREFDTNEERNLVFLSQLYQAADCLYNIGRNMQAIGYLDLARRMGKKYINHWIGSDVLDLLETSQTLAGQRLIRDIDVHLACAPWLAAELLEVGIHAHVVPIVSFDLETRLDDPPQQHTVLTYLPQRRTALYGAERVICAAAALPEIPFHVVGNDGAGEAKLSNLVYLGWLTRRQMNEHYRQCSVLLRAPLHDGLSMMVVEALAKGKEVVYSYAYPHCWHAKTGTEIIHALKQITQAPPEANLGGRGYVAEALASAQVGDQMRAVFDNL